jgi:hypothetical protein
MKLDVDIPEDLYGRARWLSETRQEEFSQTVTNLLRRGLEVVEDQEARFPLFKKNTAPDELGNDMVREALEGR